MSKVVAEVDRWIELELYTERLYDWFASRAAGEHAKALFTRLSGAGQHHAKILRKVKTILHRSKEDAKPIEVDFYTSLERREEPFKANYATDVEEAYYTMKEHLQLELDMMKFYKQMVRSLKDHDAISQLRTLANDEKEHHRELTALISTFETIYHNIIKPSKTEKNGSV